MKETPFLRAGGGTGKRGWPCVLYIPPSDLYILKPFQDKEGLK
jgi:hypothetical protein